MKRSNVFVMAAFLGLSLIAAPAFAGADKSADKGSMSGTQSTREDAGRKDADRKDMDQKQHKGDRGTAGEQNQKHQGGTMNR
jgi:hypothetical protein